ncbi:MAG: hypothetical protein O2856_00390 [Planctomycetota bacterium]|nr:hypothetical protein [Planctomycetota bacterium]
MNAKYLFLLLVVLQGRSALAENYLLRIQPVSTLETGEVKKLGTIEFHVISDQPFFLRSTFAEAHQVMVRGSLRKSDAAGFELEYFCDVAELRSDPLPRQTCQGKAHIMLGGEPLLISKLSDKNEPSPLDFKVSLKQLRPAYGAMDASSSWAVRLVDSSGKAVAGAKAGLYESWADSELDATVEGESDSQGMVRLSEGRELIPTATFYAHHEGRKLYGVANLNVDELREENYEAYTIKMTEEFTRWKKPWK